MILCLYYWENCTENHNLWQRRRCIPNAESMILADACWDFRLGTNLFLFRLANMANPTLQWNQNCHTSDIHFMTCIQIQIMCPIPVWNWWFSRTRPFAKDGDCQWVGQPAKSLLSGRFPLQSDLKHFGSESVQHKTEEQTRQKLIGKLDSVSAEILSWASRTMSY